MREACARAECSACGTLLRTAGLAQGVRCRKGTGKVNERHKPECSANGPARPEGGFAHKDHVAAALLAIFLGALGIHKFYLGYNRAAFIMLGVSVVGSLVTLGIAGGVMAVIAIVEGVMYLVKSQSEFEEIYVFGKREWF